LAAAAIAAAFATAIAAAVVPTAASAGCYGCYAPQPCCQPEYQQHAVLPQYRTVQETVMVAPGRVIAHRTPARYRTIMEPRTMMAAHAPCPAIRDPAARRNGRASPFYYVPVAPRCSTCGY
jgi:hypothetical protein